MSFIYRFTLFFIAFFALFITPSLTSLVQQQPLVLKYHNGVVLKGNVTVNIVWYGKFKPTQRSIIVDFIKSLNAVKTKRPSVASWWKTTESYKLGAGPTTLLVGKQIIYDKYPLGRSLKDKDLLGLVNKVSGPVGSLKLVFTAPDVTVEEFCIRCGTHGSIRVPRGTYIWVGNSATQCPGQCAWPFHQPIYGPQTRPLIAPNGDVGVDGMIIILATLLADTITNPYNTGYYQGPATAPVEAASACVGEFGPGSYPGYPGRVMKDKLTGSSFNAFGLNGRKYLVPAMWDPKTLSCKTLV